MGRRLVADDSIFTIRTATYFVDDTATRHGLSVFSSAFLATRLMFLLEFVLFVIAADT
jgi:hypothetical protein